MNYMYDPTTAIARQSSRDRIIDLLEDYKIDYPSCAPVYNLFGELTEAVFHLMEEYDNCLDEKKKKKLKKELCEIKAALARLKNGSCNGAPK